MQKYAYYKFLYELLKDIMEFPKVNDEKYKTFDFEQELEYLTDFYEEYSKSRNINKEKEILNLEEPKPKILIKFLNKKRKSPQTKKSDDLDVIMKSDEEKDINETKQKSQIKYYRRIDREKITHILMNKNLTFNQQKYYLNLLLEKTPKI